MSDAVICPECGGVIGATTTTEAGKPCTCFGLAEPIIPRDQSGETDTLPGMSGEDLTDVESGSRDRISTGSAKICLKCGKDVSGHRRIKDRLGYVCYECAKEERRMERGDRIKCQSCGRNILIDKMVDYEGLRLCDRCVYERQEAAKASLKKIGIRSAYQRTERQRLLKLLAVAGVLILIIILQRLKLLPPLF